MRIWIFDSVDPFTSSVPSVESSVESAFDPVEASADCEIGAAVAILRGRFGLSWEQAFAALIASSDRTGRPLPELANAVVESARRQAAARTHKALSRRSSRMRSARISGAGM